MKHIVIIFVILLLATPFLTLGLVEQARTQPNTKVGVFYYEWYNGTLNNYHWNGTASWSVEDEPTLEYYNSCDPIAVYNQLYEMQSIGINFLIVSWWGMGSFEDHAAQVLYSVANRSFPDIKLVIMVEGFNESGIYDFNYIRSYIYTTFYSAYPNEMFFLNNSTRPLLCWWNAPVMTDDNNRGPIHNDTIFDDRILGQDVYPRVDWYAWTPCSVNSSRTPYLNSKDGGVVTIEPRYDGSDIPNQGPKAVFDQNYTEGLYDNQWSFVLNNRDKISYVLIYSWNEYHERTQIEPCFQDCVSDPYYLYGKTAQYIRQLGMIPASGGSLSDYTVFDYTSFNTRLETVKDLPISYPVFGVKIDFKVTFNATTPENVEPRPKAIIKMRNASGGDISGLDIALFKTNIIDVDYVYGSDLNSTKIGGCNYYPGMIIYVLYDGTNWTVTDYGKASHVFTTFPCTNFTLRALEASGENDSTTAGCAEVTTDIATLKPVSISTKAANFLLEYTYNSTLELCSEEPPGQSKDNTFWICSDNLLAFYALQPYDQTVSDHIKSTIQEYAVNYFLPTDSSGLPISYKHEPILGDNLSGYPRNPINCNLTDESGALIYTEVDNSTLCTNWPDFADWLAWEGMSYLNQGNTAMAKRFYDAMMNMWDGYGFADKAFLQDGYYEPYKLALAIILRQRLNLPKPIQEEVMDDVLLVCQQPNGGIATGYDRFLNTAGHVENTETTALVVIANVTKLPDLRGDLNRDGVVDSSDTNILSNAFGSAPGDPNWNAAADLNHDNTVNILDAIILANNFNQDYQPSQIQVGVFLYLWYGNSTSMTGGLGSPGWNSTSCPGGGSVVDEPQAGYYVSDSNQTFQRQISEMQSAGITFAVVSWWGPFTQSEAGAINNATLDLFNYLKAANSNFKIAIMVEPFPNLDCGLPNVTLTHIYDNIYNNFVAPYDSWYFQWQGKPLLLFFNPFYPQNVDQRFTVRTIGNRPNPVDWIFWDAPQKYFDSQSGTDVNASNDFGDPYTSADGEVTIVPRIDSYYDYVFQNQTGGYLRFDPNLSNGLYRYEWTFVISHKSQVGLVLIYSFNEYHERSEIEPHYEPTRSISPSCLLKKTELYISELLN